MRPGRSSKIFNKIALKGPESVGSTLGNIGQKLVVLFENLGNHPETDSFFFEDCDVAICDLLQIAQYAEKSGMSFFARHLPLLAEAQASETLKKSRIPGRNGCSARFLRKPIRDSIRASRKTQKICSKSFVSSVRRLWHSLPDFSPFFKDSPPQKSFLDAKAVEKFSEMGCRNLAISAKDIFERFGDPPNVFGYKKLCILDACRILAKTNQLFPSDNDAHLVSSRGDACLIQAVPIHYVSSFPERIQNLLDAAEHCVSLCFDAVFDNYLLILPCPSEAQDFTSSEFRSVILGERDGECYFVCETTRLIYEHRH